MTLVLASTAHSAVSNTVDKTYSCFDTAESATFLVENLVAGTLVNMSTGNNLSDVGYNPYSNRFMFTRNNFASFHEFSESDIVNGVASPTQIRVVTVTALFGDDTEGLTDVVPNLTEGGYEFWISIENGGVNQTYNVPYSKTNMLGTSNISIGARQQLIMATVGSSNDGQEGVGFHLKNQELIGCSEGAVGVRRIYVANRPTDRDTNYDQASDAELTVTAPFDANVVVPSGSDLSSICFHEATGHILVLSETGNALYQYKRDGTLVSTLSGLNTPLFQPEGICMHGDNMVIMGETDECCYYTYTP